jgi:3-methyladenine DNA glycosylase AlkD
MVVHMVRAESLVEEIRIALSRVGDPERAVSQQRYMKSALPFRGVTAPELRALVRPLIAAHPPPDRVHWEATIRDLWDNAGYREERYAALVLARHRCARQWQDPETLRLYRHLIVTGAWWDLVDEIAGHLVGGVLASHRQAVTPVLRSWMVSDDLWLRRTAVLAQLRHGADTDTALLNDAIMANAEDRSFWLRKAIGWALREYSYTDPAWVLAEVDALAGRLSGLSRREALKHLNRASAP